MKVLEKNRASVILVVSITVQNLTWSVPSEVNETLNHNRYHRLWWIKAVGKPSEEIRAPIGKVCDLSIIGNGFLLLTRGFAPLTPEGGEDSRRPKLYWP